MPFSSFPILALENSYSFFKILIKHHLFSEGFPDSFQTEQITLLQVSTSLCKWPDLEQITHYYEPSVKRG